MTFDPLVANPHAQTLLGAGLRGLLACPAGDVQVIACPNTGDAFPCFFCPSPGPLSLLAIHGIGGEARSGLGVSLARQWLQNGLGSVLLVSLSPILRAGNPARLYHGSSTDSLAPLYEWLRQRSQSCVVIGFSLGANILVKWLSEGQQPNLKAAVSVCNPWDLKGCGRHLETSAMGRLYRRSIVEGLKKRALQLWQNYPGSLQREAIIHSRTFYEYDTAVTARLHGFQDVEEYYLRSSSWNCLEQIQNPVVHRCSGRPLSQSRSEAGKEAPEHRTNHHLQRRPFGLCRTPQGVLAGTLPLLASPRMGWLAAVENGNRDGSITPLIALRQ